MSRTKILHKIQLVFIIAFLGACDYKFDENFVEVNIPPAKDVIFKFNFSEEDTVYVRSSGFVSFVFDLSTKGDISGYEILIDGNTVLSYNDAPNGYRLEPSSFSSGYHDFKVRIFQSSNSGSLADELESEVYIDEFNKVLLIDNDIIEPLNIEKTTITSEGELVVEWKEFTSWKFEKYVIITGYDANSDPIEIVITDPHQHQLTLPYFPGGNLSLRMILHAKGETEWSYPSYFHDLDFRAYKISSSQIRVTANATPFAYSKEVEIRVRSFIEGETSQSFILPYNGQVLDEVIDFSTSFPYDFTVYFSIVNQEERSFIGKQSSDDEFSKFSSPLINFASDRIMIENDNSFYVYSVHDHRCCEDRIGKYDFESQERIVGMTGDFTLSPNNEFLFGAKKSDRLTLVLTKYDKSTLEELESRDIIDLLPLHSSRVDGLFVSDDEYILALYNQDSYLLYNWRSQEIVDQGDDFYFINSYTLSLEGKYLMHVNRYIDFQNTTVVNALSDENADVLRNLPSKNQYISYKNGANAIQLYSFPDRTLIREYAVENEVLELYTNHLNHIAALTISSDKEYFFEVYSLDDISNNMVISVTINETALPDNYKDIMFEENYLLIKDKPDYYNRHFFEKLNFSQ